MKGCDSSRPRRFLGSFHSKTSDVLVPGRGPSYHFLSLTRTRSEVEKLHGNHLLFLHFSFWKICVQRLARGSAP